MRRIAPDFGSYAKRIRQCILSGYVLVDATRQTDQRTSQMVYLFFAEALTFLALRFRLGPESRKLAYLVYFKEQKAL